MIGEQGRLVLLDSLLKMSNCSARGVTQMVKLAK